MKKRNIYWLAFSIGIIIVFMACSKDESISKRWTYNTSVSDSASVFIGSSVNGGVVSDTFKVFTSGYFGRLFENYQNTFISFDENVITISQKDVMTEVSLYKFVNDTLWVARTDSTDIESGRSNWACLGYKRNDSLVIVQHYAYAKRADGTISLKQVAPVRGINSEEVAKNSVFGSLKNMTDTRDTLIWGVRRSVFL